MLLNDSLLSLIDGIILIIGLFVALGYLTVTSLRSKQNNTEAIAEEIPDYTIPKAITWTLVGLVLLLISSRILVVNSIDLAVYFGVSDVVIGLTIVAIGTSLPELAASITGALKHHSDLAVGNVVGSNIFNTLGVIGIPGLVHSYAIPNEILTRDYPIMLGLTLLLVVVALVTCKSKGLHRGLGTLLLACFVAYQVTLYIQSVSA